MSEGSVWDMLHPLVKVADVKMHWLVTSKQTQNFLTFFRITLKPQKLALRTPGLTKPSTSLAHAASTVACRAVGKWASPLTCLSPLCSADAVLGAGDVLTSWWVLSVLLHSSFRFSSSLSLCFCNRRRVAEEGVPPRTLSADGLCPRPSLSTPGKPVLAEPSVSRPVLSPLLYSAQRFRMVSSRCLSWGKMQTNQRGTPGEGLRHLRFCFLLDRLLHIPWFKSEHMFGQNTLKCC